MQHAYDFDERYKDAEGTPKDIMLGTGDMQIPLSAIRELILALSGTQDASTTQKGVVMLSNDLNSISESLTPTMKALNQVLTTLSNDVYKKLDKAKSVTGDLNDLKTTGLYFGYNFTNGKRMVISTFIVIQYSPDWIIQIQLIPQTNEVFFRSYYNGTTWSDWDELLTSLKLNVPLGIPQLNSKGELPFAILPTKLKPSNSPITDTASSPNALPAIVGSYSSDLIRFVSSGVGVVRVFWNGTSNSNGVPIVSTRVLKNGVQMDERSYGVAVKSPQFIVDLQVDEGDIISLQIKIATGGSPSITLGISDAFIGSNLVRFERTL